MPRTRLSVGRHARLSIVLVMAAAAGCAGPKSADHGATTARVRADADAIERTDAATATQPAAPPDAGPGDTMAPRTMDAVLRSTSSDAAPGTPVTVVPGATARASVDDRPPGDPCKDVMIPEAQGALDGFQFNLWLPGGIPTIRCVVMGGGAMLELARQNHCAVMRIPSMPTPNGPQIVAALKNFARITGHPELEFAGVATFGYSFTYAERTRQAIGMPDRIITMVGGGIAGILPTMPAALRAVPWLAFDGSLDVAYVPKEYLTDKHRIGPAPWYTHQVGVARQAGALFGQAIRWGSPHENGDAAHVIYPYFHQMVNRRAPKVGQPITQTQLAAIPETEGWLVSADDWLTAYPSVAPYQAWPGDPKQASWTPDSYLAFIVRAFTAKDSPVAITTPACTADKCQPPLVASGDDYTVEVEAKGAAPQKVQLFDGDRPLATLTAAPYRFMLTGLDLGVHAFIAEATYADHKAVSKPRSVVVARRKAVCP